MKQRLTGLAATLTLAALLVGTPVVLAHTAPRRWPSLGTWHDLMATILRPDDGILALTAIWMVALGAWAILTGLILAELAALLRGTTLRPLTGLRLPQAAARHLISAAALLFVAAPTLTQPVPPALAAPVVAERAPTDVTADPSPDTTTRSGKPAPASSTLKHTVRRGETLWEIAEQHLGSPRRYPEIIQANQRLLSGDPDTLQPGWVLKIPHGTPAAPKSGTFTEYTVTRGDTLSEIALEHLGDASAWPKIAKASRAIEQPDGRRLTDPDQIDIGWTLRIPDKPSKTSALADQPRHHPSSTPRTRTGPVTTAAESPSLPDVSSAQGPTAAPTTTPTATPNSTTSSASILPTPTPTMTSAGQQPLDTPDDQADSVAVAPSWLLAGFTGAGGLLAAALLVSLRRRRAYQSRWRRPGRTIATAPPELEPVEKTLIHEGTPAASTVEVIHQTLLTLSAAVTQTGAPLPQLAAAELGDDQLTLHLSAPADLPSPWQAGADRLRWHAPTTDVAPDSAAVDAIAPYPQLVTVGDDDQNHVWLLNLEQFGTVSVTGSPTHVHDFARYVAAEIAVNPWSQDVELECLGLCPEIAPLSPAHVRHHDNATFADVALADTVHTVNMIGDRPHDVASARIVCADDHWWPSRFLMLSAGLASDATRELMRLQRTHPGRTGTSVLVAGADTEPAGLQLHLSDDGRLTIPAVGLDLIAVGLTSDEAAGCADLLAQADDTDDVPVPQNPDSDGWRALSDQAGALRPDLTIPRNTHPIRPTEVTASLLPDPDPAYLDSAATTEEDLAALAPQVPIATRDLVLDADPTLDDDVRAWFDPTCPLPRLSVLGPLLARVGPTGKPIAAAKRKPYYTELLAYLATRPNGATPEEVAEAFGVKLTSARSLVKVVREWLGTNPRTGRMHVPAANDSEAGKARGMGVYQVEDLLFDADLFRRLRLRAQARGPEGIEDLRTALSLVRGEPFSHLRKEGGAWLAEGARLDHHLVCAIVDVAHTVTTASLRSGDAAGAREATEIALNAAPHEEIPRVDLVAVCEAEGHHAEARQILWSDIINRSEDDGPPMEVPLRTESIVNGKRWLEQRRVTT